MNSKNTLSLMMALVLSLLLIPAAQMDLQAQAPRSGVRRIGRGATGSTGGPDRT